MAVKNSIGDKPLTVPYGGTGLGTLTANGILTGNVVSPISSIDAATNGQLFIGSTGNAPAWATVDSSDGSVTRVTGVNTLTLSAAGSIGPVQSWTPAVTWSNGRTFSSISNIEGSYVQIGKLIYWQGFINGTVSGGSGGSAYITGLPGTFDTNIPGYYQGMFVVAQRSPNTNPWPQLFSFLDTSNGRINVIQNEPSSNNTSWLDPIAGGGSQGFFANGYYFVV